MQIAKSQKVSKLRNYAIAVTLLIDDKYMSLFAQPYPSRIYVKVICMTNLIS